MSIKVLYWNEEASGSQFAFEPCSVNGGICWASVILVSEVGVGGPQISGGPHCCFKPVTPLSQGDWGLDNMTLVYKFTCVYGKCVCVCGYIPYGHMALFLESNEVFMGFAS